MSRIEARISSIEGSWARWTRRSESPSRSLELELTALIPRLGCQRTLSDTPFALWRELALPGPARPNQVNRKVNLSSPACASAFMALIWR